MKYETMIRSRAKRVESIAEKHKRFFTQLSEISPPWGIKGAVVPEPPAPGGNLGVGVSVSKLLGKGVSGRAYYVFRREFEDLGMHDDFFDMSFNPAKWDYRQFAYDVLPKYIVAFDAYFAQVGHVEFGHVDFDAERNFGSGDTRFGVYRVRPVSFFDRILCERAFGINPREIAARLQGSVESVELLQDGVYVIGSSQVMKFEEADSLCWKIKRRITKSS